MLTKVGGVMTTKERNASRKEIEDRTRKGVEMLLKDATHEDIISYLIELSIKIKFLEYDIAN